MGTNPRADLYERLRQHYDKGASYVPHRRESAQILQLIFTPPEAELALSIPMQSQGRASLKEIAEKSGRDKEELQELLEKMAQKGIVFVRTSKSLGEPFYALWEINRLLYTTTYGDGVDNDEKRLIATLREKLWAAGWPYMLYSSTFPITRVLPFEGGIGSTEKIAPFESASHFVEQASLIATIACACRVSTRRCDKPINNCIHFDGEAEHLIRYKNGKIISKEECLRLIEASVKQGLVMTVGNQQDRIGSICTCCPTCCLFLRPYIENNIPNALAKSNFLPHFDAEKCKLCLTCKKNCPVGAIGVHLSHSSSDPKEHTMVIEERCIGCGVCTAVCPRGAIRLKKVRNLLPAPNAAAALTQHFAQRKW